MYSTKIEENMAKALGPSLPISLKQSVEVCSFIRGKDSNKAINLLEAVMQFKQAVPYKKFNRGGTGHRKGGMGPGRYPIKVSTHIIQLLKSAQQNARQKNLDGDLIVKAAVAKQGPKTMRYGRKRGRTAKRTHIEIVLMQIKAKAPDKKAPKAAKPAKPATPAPKAEVKPAPAPVAKTQTQETKPEPNK